MKPFMSILFLVYNGEQVYAKSSAHFRDVFRVQSNIYDEAF